MEKTPRYTQRERNMVLGFAAQYKDVIENKRTDAESNRKKDEVWRQIAKEFNARVYHQRSSKQLRQLYKNMKLLLKKDLCGEGKSNRSFMDLLNTLSQQESVAQYMAEQMSPGAYSSTGRQQKYDDDYDDSKMPSVSFDGMDTDVIVIKSEDISDNEQSQNGGNPTDMEDDDDDCLSPKDIPEVCLEEEEDEIFSTDIRSSVGQQSQTQRPQIQVNPQTQLPTAQQNSPHMSNHQPEVTIQNVGGIRVGSIGSIANLKALHNGSNSALSINNNCNNNNNSNNNGAICNNNASTCNNNNNNPLRQTTAEQEQQQLLLSGLGLSAVHPVETPQLPTLQRGTTQNNQNSSISSVTNQLLLSLSGNNYGSKPQISNGGTNFGGGSNSHQSNHGHNHNSHSHGHNHGSSASSRNNDYLMSLAIEERKRKIDLLNAQIDYWKTLTKKLDANMCHNPSPSCPCHFPGKVNALQAQSNSS